MKMMKEEEGEREEEKEIRQPLGGIRQFLSAFFQLCAA
jgi:hypothetical protein